jgi:hypothetical protein
MSEFVQIMEFQTDRIDEVEAHIDRMRDELGDRLKFTESIFCTDRGQPNTYVAIVEFPSYEVAMDNSTDPEVSKFAAGLTKLLGTSPSFRNLDVRSRT